MKNSHVFPKIMFTQVKTYLQKLPLKPLHVGFNIFFPDPQTGLFSVKIRKKFLAIKKLQSTGRLSARTRSNRRSSGEASKTMDYKSVFTNLCLELQQNRSWIKGLGKNPQKSELIHCWQCLLSEGTEACSLGLREIPVRIHVIQRLSQPRVACWHGFRQNSQKTECVFTRCPTGGRKKIACLNGLRSEGVNFFWVVYFRIAVFELSRKLSDNMLEYQCQSYNQPSFDIRSVCFTIINIIVLYVHSILTQFSFLLQTSESEWSSTPACEWHNLPAN